MSNILSISERNNASLVEIDKLPVLRIVGALAY